MQWWRLKTLNCPRCVAHSPLTKNMLGYQCGQRCGFQIGNKKFDDVVNKLYRQPTADSEDTYYDKLADEQDENENLSDIDQM